MTEPIVLVDQLLDEHPPAETDATEFLEGQFDLGLAWVDFEPGRGGRRWSRSLQAGVDERLAAAGAPSAFRRNPLGVGMCAPTLHEHASPALQDRLLRPLFAGTEIWAQLFSEPGAGSDLAAVATKAVRDGDSWVVSGQKVWTSYAHKATWGLLIARTDPHAPKHAGLTTFVVDLGAPGVEVRPLYQMTGEAVFNEVYLTDVRIHDDHRVGALGAGWGVTLTTLAHERAALGDADGAGAGHLDVALALWRRLGGSAPARLRLVDLWIRAQVLQMLTTRLGQARVEGGIGVEGNLAKVLGAELNQDLTEVEIELLGTEALLKPGGYPLARSSRDPFAVGDVVHDFLRAQANTIEGGTSNIGRNLLAERLLGLPAEPRADKGVPWSEVLRS